MSPGHRPAQTKRKEARGTRAGAKRPQTSREASVLPCDSMLYTSFMSADTSDRTAIKRIHPKRGGSIAAMLPGEARATPPRDRTVPEFFWPQSALYCALAAHEATHRVVSDGTCFGVFLLRHDSACVCVCVCVCVCSERARQDGTTRQQKHGGEARRERGRTLGVAHVVFKVEHYTPCAIDESILLVDVLEHHHLRAFPEL